MRNDLKQMRGDHFKWRIRIEEIGKKINCAICKRATYDDDRSSVKKTRYQI